jgi:hypothetical protein
MEGVLSHSVIAVEAQSMCTVTSVADLISLLAPAALLFKCQLDNDCPRLHALMSLLWALCPLPPDLDYRCLMRVAAASWTACSDCCA